MKCKGKLFSSFVLLLIWAAGSTYECIPVVARVDERLLHIIWQLREAFYCSLGGCIGTCRVYGEIVLEGV